DRSLSTCSRLDCDATPCELETHLPSHENHLDSPSDLLLREVLPTYAGSWEETLPHEPTMPCAYPTMGCAQQLAHRPGQPTCKSTGRRLLTVIQAFFRRC